MAAASNIYFPLFSSLRARFNKEIIILNILNVFKPIELNCGHFADRNIDSRAYPCIH